MMPLPQQSQQVNYNQGVMSSGRNPNLKIQQYGQLSNDSHFVTSVDPGSRTVFINNMNPVEPNLEKKHLKIFHKFLNYLIKNQVYHIIL